MLVNERQNAGRYSFNFNAGGLTSGVYFYKIENTGDFKEIKRMILFEINNILKSYEMQEIKKSLKSKLHLKR